MAKSITVLSNVVLSESLGVKDIFEASSADLSEISSDKLEVGDVLHAAQLEVNEEGSEAVAVTTIDIDIRLASSGIKKPARNVAFSLREKNF